MATPIRSNYAPGAAGDQQYQLALQRNLPTAPSSTNAPVAMPTTQQGQIEQQLKSGVNAGGQALSAVQKSSLENQLNQVTGKTTQVQAQANRENATKTALQNSKTINNYAAVTPQSVAKQVELNNKYELNPTTGLNGKDPYDPSASGNSFELMRNHEKEAKMAKKLGGLPQTPEELDKFFRATYSAKQLQEMGYVPPPPPQGGSGGPGVQGGTAFNSGAAGSTPIYDQAKLAALGLTQERLDQLIKSNQISPEMLNQLKSSGDAANIAQANLNATAKPTNSMMGVLQEALQAKNNFQNQKLGVSDLFGQAGVSGYAVLGDSLAMRSKEMDGKFQSAASLIQKTGGAMADVYSGMLEQYKASKDDYNKQMDRVIAADQRAKDHEWSLEQMKTQIEMQEAVTQRAREWELNNPTKQFIPESDTQEAGYFNPKTGEFTPLGSSESSGGSNENATSDGPNSSYTGGGKYNVTPTKNGVTVKVEVGAKAGQCGRFVNDYLGIPSYLGNSYESKMKRTDPSIKIPSAGMGFVMPYKSTGHTGIVESVDLKNKVAYVVDSNWGLDEKVKRHAIPLSKISGYIVPPKGKSVNYEAPPAPSGNPMIAEMERTLGSMKAGSPQALQYAQTLEALKGSMPEMNIPAPQQPMDAERELIRNGGMSETEIKAQRDQLKNDIKKYKRYPDKVAEAQAKLNQLNEDFLYSKQNAASTQNKELQRLPADKVVMLEDAKFLPDTLSNLEKSIKSGKGTFSPVWGNVDKVNPLAWSDTNKQTVNAELRTATQLVGKYMEGGVLRAEDEVKYKAMMPNNTDTQDIALEKLKQIKLMLKNKTAGYIQGFNTAGYDVQGYMNDLAKLTGGDGNSQNNSSAKDSLGLFSPPGSTGSKDSLKLF